MSKRLVTELQTTSESDGQAYSKTSGGIHTAKRENIGKDEMGEFEDAWEDEIESDEEAVDAEATEGEDGIFHAFEDRDPPLITVILIGMDVDEVLPAIEETEEQQPAPDIFIPGSRALAKDEVLEPDDSVYIMRHSMNVNWPCLSFDILRDSLGDHRQRYPATAYLVAGTQADLAKNNELSVYKMSSLHRTQKDGGEPMSDSSVPENVHSSTHSKTTRTRTMMRITTISMKIPYLNFDLYPT